MGWHATFCDGNLAIFIMPGIAYNSPRLLALFKSLTLLCLIAVLIWFSYRIFHCFF
jgi:hypothetical protein